LSVCFSSDGNTLLTGSTDKTARLWDVATGREIRCFKGHAAGIIGVAVSPDGKVAATSRSPGDGTVRVWDRTSGKQLAALASRGAHVYASCTRFSPAQRILAVQDSYGYLALWDTDTFERIGQKQVHERPTPYAQGLAFAPKAPVVAAGGRAGYIHLWSVPTLDKLGTLKGHRDRVNDLSFSSDGSLLASCAWDGQICLWRRGDKAGAEPRTVPVPRHSGKPEHFKAKLPPGFEKSFMLPDSDKDQHGNPVVVRNGSRVDPDTGYPYEIWLNLPAAPTAAQAGEPRMEFVLIPAGEFMMGNSAEEIKRLNEKYRTETFVRNNPDWFTGEGPRHRVRITKPFYLAKYETTVAQFRWFVQSTDYRTDAEKGRGATVYVDRKWQQKSDASWRNPYFEQGDANPAVCVNWNDASAFCKALSGSKGGEFTLPTEAQWEYACRAGSEGQYCYGHDAEAMPLADYAWFNRNSGHKAHSVGEKKANEWRVYDMHGNAWEWCLDGRRAYSGSSQIDPRGSQSGSRVLRGGSWGLSPSHARCANRYDRHPSYLYNYVGFRVLLLVPLER